MKSQEVFDQGLVLIMNNQEWLDQGLVLNMNSQKWLDQGQIHTILWTLDLNQLGSPE